MKVIIVSRGYPTEKYKLIGIFEFDQAKALVEAGVKVVYASVDLRSIFRWRKWGYESFVKDGVQVEAINIPCGRIPNTMLNKIREKSLKKLYNNIVKKYGKPEIVHSHFIDVGFASAKIFNKCKDISLVHTEHYSAMNKEEIDNYYKYLGNNTYLHMDKNIAVSKALANNMKKNFQIEPTVIPNIVDTFSFEYKPVFINSDEFNFVSVGSLTKNKGMDLLINSFYDAFKDNKKVKLYIFGEGSERKNLETIIDNLSLNNRVFLMGLVDRKEIASKMHESHCFVLASQSETFGVSYIEALASGLPVIATKCGGPETFVNEKNGILVPIDNQEELSTALKYVYNNLEEYNREKISNITVEKFGSVRIAKLIMKEYKDLLK